MKSSVIGIDLGTSHSCVAVFQNNKVEVIANEQGNRKTASFVSFAENEILVGEDAKNRGAKHSENTIFDAKRLIGIEYNTNEKFQNDSIYWPFKLVNDASTNLVNIEINFKQNKRTLNPETILSMILKKMKLDAESYLKYQVSDTVISIPNHFNESQRKLVKDACELSGLNLLKLTNETSLVGLAYQVEKQITQFKNVFIFDMGSGFLNLSVVQIDKDKIEVKSSAGNPCIGGRDIDNRLVKHFLDEFKQKNNINLINNKRAVYRLKNACEKVKHELSLAVRTTIDIDSFYNDLDLNSSITREQFEQINSDLFTQIIESVSKCLNDSKLSREQIDDILIVGGSSRIPKVQEMLKEYFGKELNKSMNSDESVACGAAIQAVCLTKANKFNSNSSIQDIKLIDVTPLTLGVETYGGMMASIIKRNTSFPVKVSRLFTAHNENQSSALIKLFEGEDSMTKNNHFLGSYVLDNINKQQGTSSSSSRSSGSGSGGGNNNNISVSKLTSIKQTKMPQIEITLEIDSNSSLNINLADKTNGNIKKITVAGLNKKRFINDKLKSIDLVKKT